MGQAKLFNLGMATSLGEGKLHHLAWHPVRVKGSVYIYIYIRGAYDKFPGFFRMGIENCHRPLKIHYVIAIYLRR